MRTAGLLVIAGLSAVGALLLIQRGTRQETLVVGGALLLVGLPLLVLARRQLGDSFSVNPEAKGLVTHGLYSRFPHPMYVFLDVAVLGAVVALRRTWLLLAWAALLLAQLWQARREARVLEEAFGDAYREYRRRTWW